jgi:hypothetical protein
MERSVSLTDRYQFLSEDRCEHPVITHGHVWSNKIQVWTGSEKGMPKPPRAKLQLEPSTVAAKLRFTMILGQELIPVSKADATLHPPDNNDSAIGIPVYFGEHFAYGERSHLSMRLLLSRRHATNHNDGDHPARRTLHPACQNYSIHMQNLILQRVVHYHRKPTGSVFNS